MPHFIIKYYFILLLFSTWLVLTPNLYGQLDQEIEIKQSSSDARNLMEEGYYYKASEKLKEIIRYKEINRPDNPVSIANSYLNLSIINVSINRSSEALIHAHMAEEILIQIDQSHPKLAPVYGVTAGIYNSLRDFERSKIYYAKTISLLSSEKNIDNYLLGTAYINLSFSYSSLNDEKNSMLYLDLAEYLFLDTEISYFQLYLAAYSITQRFKNEEKVFEYLNKMKNILESDAQVSINYLVTYYIYSGDYYSEYKNDNQTSLNYYKEILKITLEKFNESHPLSTRILVKLSQYYYNSGYYSQSLQFAERVIQNLDFDFKVLNKNLSEIPEENLIKLNYLVMPLEYLIRSKYLIYLRSNNISDLKEAYDNAFYLTKILDILRWQYDNQSAEYLVGDEDADNYKMGQVLANELYRVTGEEKYIDEAFEFNERAKGFNLLSNLRTQSAMEFGGIPSELLKREADLNQKVSTYKELIHDEEQIEKPDTKKIDNWQNSLFSVSREYDDLINFFEENYPEYYNLKFNTEVISLNDVGKKLSKDDLILEYSLKDSLLFTYVISRKEKSMYKQVVDSSFRTKCLDLYDILTIQSFSHNVRQTYKDYTQVGHELYEILIAPVKDHLKGKNVIVVPDEEISYVPFEALLTEEVDPEKIDYYRLPYLVKENGFSTSYSSTIHFIERKRKNHPGNEILAFAPTYSNIKTKDAGFQLLRQSDADKLIRIPGVKEEVNKISEMLDADVFRDLQATETNFKNLAENYRILHLAMHTILDDENPLYSKLAFTQIVDSINDGFLHTYEIYNMQINAELAVLSSCSSGFGNLQEGQGIQSLARGFSYAGCPSILMTLWEVADKSTVEVMERFYHYLGKGNSKAAALHKAKLDFLENADQLKSNPFFWSSFVLIGDTEPIYTSKLIILLINLGILAIPVPIFLILFVRYRRRKAA